MKFPLSESPFPQLALTHEQCQDVGRLATALLLETVAEYDAFVHQHKRAMHSKQWKAVKTRESVTVYRKRETDDTKSVTVPSVPSPTRWSLPKLVAVGTIVGSVDDVMYGIAAPATECVKIKTSYMEDDVVDDMLLQQLQYATVDDPYKFLGVKWVVKAGAGVGSWPRDYVFVEATGTHDLAIGERIGYQIQHSVNLNDCRDLKDLGIVRATSSSCSLFKQLSNGTVDVYIRSYVEPSSKFPERVAMSTAASEMIDCWKAIECAQNKKLAWLIREASAKSRHRNRQRGRDEFGDYVGTMKTDAKGKYCCALCTQKFSAFRTPVTCELCKDIVCTRCKTGRKLTYVHTTIHNTKVSKIPTALCKTCVSNANNMNAIDFARSDHVPPDMAPPPQSPAPSITSSSSSRRRHQTTVSSESSSVRSLRKHPSEDNRQLSLADTEGSSLPAWSMHSSEGSELSFSRDSVEIDAVDDWHRQRPQVTHEELETKGQMILLKQPHEASLPHQAQYYHTESYKPTQQEEMYMQMNQLRLQAEQVYRITRQNNQSIGDNQWRQW